MPFSRRFNDIYNLVIKELENELDVIVNRSDKLPFDTRQIYDQIISEISSANVIIADLSKNNPNVFYELGYAHSLGKIVVPISSDELPFDIAGFPTIFYNKNDLSELKKNLKLRIKEALEIFISKEEFLLRPIIKKKSKLLSIVKKYAMNKAIESNWSKPGLYFTQEHLATDTGIDISETYLMLDTLRKMGTVTAVNWKGDIVWMALNK